MRRSRTGRSAGQAFSVAVQGSVWFVWMKPNMTGFQHSGKRKAKGRLPVGALGTGGPEGVGAGAFDDVDECIWAEDLR